MNRGPRGAELLLGLLGLLGLALAPCACASPTLPRHAWGALTPEPRPPIEVIDPSPVEWKVSRDRLAQVRAARPVRPYVERIAVAMQDPRTGRRYQARGAVAVSPDRAARMLLVGPGGATALDLWVTKDQFRFAVPSMKYERRGADADEANGFLPVGLLRWWFLSPLAGRLLAASSTRSETEWILRDDGATVTVRSDGRHFAAVRRDRTHLEGLEWAGLGLIPHAGTRGRYVEGRFGLRVEVVVEEVLPNEPDPEAFLDPDAQGTAL